MNICSIQIVYARLCKLQTANRIPQKAKRIPHTAKKQTACRKKSKKRKANTGPKRKKANARPERECERKREHVVPREKLLIRNRIPGA